MPVMLKLVRRPRSASYRKLAVQTEIRHALEDQSKTAVDRLQQDITDWADQPDFKTDVAVSGTKVSLSVSVDGRSQAGKIYGWVNDGTGERGNDKSGTAYEIYPRKEGGRLGPFFVPHSPVTFPNPAISGFPSGDEPVLVFPQSVHAPGIYPRNFIATILEELKGVGVGTFRNVIDAAIKRGLRK